MSCLECFFDCSSPWSYLCFHNLERLAAEFGLSVRWRPILVGGIFNSVNAAFYATRASMPAAKTRYLQKDLRDWSRMAGVQLEFPPAVFPVNSVKAMRGCLLAEERGLLTDFTRAIFKAYWQEGHDISTDEVLTRICQSVGMEPGWFFEGVSRADIKKRLRTNGEELIARGGFGTPTIYVGGSDMYFGNDRLPLVRHALSLIQLAPAANPRGNHS